MLRDCRVLDEKKKWSDSVQAEGLPMSDQAEELPRKRIQTKSTVKIEDVHVEKQPERLSMNLEIFENPNLLDFVRI